MEKTILYAIDVPETGVTYIGLSNRKSGIGMGEVAALGEVAVVDTSTLTDRKIHPNYVKGVRKEWEDTKPRLETSLIEAEVKKVINKVGPLLP